MEVVFDIEQKKLQEYLAAVPENYRDGNLLMAYYASFSGIFTPDMLYQLLATFNTYYKEEKIFQINYMAISDLLLSDLCSEISHELFEMEEGMQKYLQSQPSEHLWQFEFLPTKESLAALIYQYAQKFYNHPFRKNIKDVLYWKALSILSPEYTGYKIAESLHRFSKKVEPSIEEVQLLLQLMNLEEELGEDNNLKIEYSRYPAISDIRDNRIYSKTISHPAILYFFKKNNKALNNFNLSEEEVFDWDKFDQQYIEDSLETEVDRINFLKEAIEKLNQDLEDTQSFIDRDWIIEAIETKERELENSEIKIKELEQELLGYLEPERDKSLEKKHFKDDAEILESLMNSSSRRQNAALEYIYGDYSNSIRLYLKNNGTSDNDIDEIIQEMVFRLHSILQKKGYSTIKNLKGYVFTIARHIWFEKKRKEQKRTRIEFEIDDYQNIDNEKYSNLKPILDIAIKRLDEREHKIILEILQGKKLVDIANSMDINADYIRQISYKSRKKLKKIIQYLNVIKENNEKNDYTNFQYGLSLWLNKFLKVQKKKIKIENLNQQNKIIYKQLENEIIYGKHKTIFLVGKNGTGKTRIAEKITIYLSNFKDSENKNPYFPIYLNFSYSLGKIEINIFNQIKTNIEQVLGYELLEKELLYLSRERIIIVIIDNLNINNDSETETQQILSEIRRLGDKNSSFHFLITSQTEINEKYLQGKVIKIENEIPHFYGPEFNIFLKACNQNFQLAEELYAANGRLSNQFRILLTDYFIVFLRNALNNKLSEYFEDPNWILNKYELLPNVKNKHIVSGLKKRFKRIGTEINITEIVKSLTLGFWTELFLASSYKDLRGRPINIFTNRPSNFSRAKVYNSLNRIRAFRNRIVHGDSIVFAKNNSEIDLLYAENIYNEIYSVLGWLNIELVELVRPRENVMKEISNIKKKFRILLSEENITLNSEPYKEVKTEIIKDEKLEVNTVDLYEIKRLNSNQNDKMDFVFYQNDNNNWEVIFQGKKSNPQILSQQGMEVIRLLLSNPTEHFNPLDLYQLIKNKYNPEIPPFKTDDSIINQRENDAKETLELMKTEESKIANQTPIERKKYWEYRLSLANALLSFGYRSKYIKEWKKAKRKVDGLSIIQDENFEFINKDIYKVYRNPDPTKNRKDSLAAGIRKVLNSFKSTDLSFYNYLCETIIYRNRKNFKPFSFQPELSSNPDLQNIEWFTNL